MTLAKEGFPSNILVNAISPMASSKLTEIFLKGYLNTSAEMIAPFVALLASEDFKETGGIYEVGGGHIKKLRW